MKSNYKKIGNYIRLVDERNKELKATELLGININKYFMPSVANIVGTDLSRYKIVKQSQFACNRMHVGRDKRIPIALSDKEYPFIVSPAYDVFEIINTDELDPEYLMMWFSRKEFDRNAWFYTDADVRGGLSWDAFCSIQLPIPNIERQKEIVAEYNTIVNRIKLNEELNKKLEETAQAIYKRWFVEFEFPNEEGKTTLSDIVVHIKEIVNPINVKFNKLIHYSIPNYDEDGLASIEDSKAIRSNKYKVVHNSILVSKLNPKFSRVWNLFGNVADNSVCSTEFQVLQPKNIDLFGYIYFTLKSNYAIDYFSSRATGTSNSHQRIKPNEILKMPLTNFSKKRASEFSRIALTFLKEIRFNLQTIVKLKELKNLLLSKMTKV